jgi:hypothetical protein
MSNRRPPGINIPFADAARRIGISKVRELPSGAKYVKVDDTVSGYDLREVQRQCSIVEAWSVIPGGRKL